MRTDAAGRVTSAVTAFALSRRGSAARSPFLATAAAAFLLAGTAPPALAQTSDPPPLSSLPPAEFFQGFSLSPAPLAAAASDTIPPPADPARPALGENPEISPGGAFLRSLLVPGWGHAATGAHFRGGFYIAAQSGALWMLAKSMARRRDAGRFRRSEVNAARERLRVQGITSPDSLRILAPQDPRVQEWDERIESRSQQVEDWASASLFLLLLGATDAFVAGHLMDRPEPLSLQVGPEPGGGWSISGSIRPGNVLPGRP